MVITLPASLTVEPLVESENRRSASD